MEQRFNVAQLSPAGYKAMAGLEVFLTNSKIEKNLLHLIKCFGIGRDKVTSLFIDNLMDRIFDE